MPKRPFKGTRGDRLRRRLEILGEQTTTPSRGMARHLRLKLADLRRTDSGRLTERPKQPFVLKPPKSISKKAKTEQQRYHEEKAKRKRGKEKEPRKGGKGRRLTRGGKPGREPAKKKKE